MSLSSRLPAFLFLAVVVAAAALRIAGLGVAVGIGMIVGFLLGWLVIVAFLAMNPGSRPSVAHLTSNTRGPSPDQAAIELMERHGFDSMRVAGVDSGALRRVIPVGSSVEQAGVRIELVALEIREDGVIATIVAHTRPPLGHMGHFIEVAVSDDAGTTYVASGQGIGGSGPGTSRCEIRVAPAPPAGARVLQIRVERFIEPFVRRETQVAGPWEFRVDL